MVGFISTAVWSALSESPSANLSQAPLKLVSLNLLSLFLRGCAHWRYVICAFQSWYYIHIYICLYVSLSICLCLSIYLCLSVTKQECLDGHTNIRPLGEQRLLRWGMCQFRSEISGCPVKDASEGKLFEEPSREFWYSSKVNVFSLNIFFHMSLKSSLRLCQMPRGISNNEIVEPGQK